MLNDHDILKELVRIRMEYGKAMMWVKVLAGALALNIFLLWTTTGRVRWIERKWDQGKILIVEQEDSDAVRETIRLRQGRGR